MKLKYSAAILADKINKINQKGFRKKSESKFCLWVGLIVEFSFLKCYTDNLFFFICVVIKVMAWKPWFLSTKTGVLFSVQLMREKFRELLLFSKDYTVMNCRENIFWALSYKTLRIFWQFFFCPKMSFHCSSQTLKCQFTKIWQNSFSRWYIEGRRDKLRERPWLSPSYGKPSFQPQSG